MKKKFKWMTLALAACGAFVGCSDNGGSPDFDMDKPFDIVLSKFNYTYKAKDSLLIIKGPVCKESVDGGLKYLDWKKETSKPDTLDAYVRKDRAYLRTKSEKDYREFTYDGSSFPKGTWVNVADSKNSIFNAKKFTSSEIKNTFQYDGACFMKSLYSQLFKDNGSLEGAEAALSKFYLMFSTEKNPVLDEDDLVDNLRVPACDELSMYDGEVSIKINSLQASSGKIQLKYKNESCLISFNLRYANNESDCQTAYDEFKLDRNAEETFSFSNYGKTVDYSYNCIAGLVQQLRKDDGTLKKATPVDEYSVNQIANASVDLLLAGMKE